MNPTQDNSKTPSPPHLLQHLVLLVEELHLDVSTDRKWLRELKQHQFVFPAGVGGVRGVDLHLELVHDKLGVCGGSTGTPVNSTEVEAMADLLLETHCRCLR